MNLLTLRQKSQAQTLSHEPAEHIFLTMKRFISSVGILFCSVTAFAIQEPRAGWTIEARDYDAEYTGVPVASGTIGILPWKEPFSVRHVMLNHVFDIGSNGVNKAVRGINPFNVSMSVNGTTVDGKNITGWQQQIDMKHAIHGTSFIADKAVEVDYDIRALRNAPHCGMMQIRLKALRDTEVELHAGAKVPSDYTSSKTEVKALKAEREQYPVLHSEAMTSTGRHRTVSTSRFIVRKGDFENIDGSDNLGMKIRLKKGDEAEINLIASLCTTRDFIDPTSEADRQVIFMSREGIDRLVSRHENQWKTLWQGDIEIEGDPEAQQAIRLALFNLYGFGREGSRLSMSPMGLSSQGYSGHVFWDSEIWMYPPMLFLNPGIARSMIDYRVDRLPGARRRAAASGYSGAMFPWESDDWGEESTPTWAVTGSMEHHITADVAIAAWNYYRMTGDREWLGTSGWPLIRDVADFWTSRVEPGKNGTWSINNVVGADEYASGVNDNAFTNGAAKTALDYACKAAAELGYKADPRWREISDNIVILKDKNGLTLEFDGYDGRGIKQADVNLLAYPLNIITDRADVERDLEFYKDRIDMTHGPAMTFGIFTVSYARLGNREKAEQMFRRSYRPNMRPPFGVLAETPTSQNPYFATGGGALLQAVINGFGGLELTDQGITQLPSVLPASWKKLTIKGVGPDQKEWVIEN